MKKAFEEFRPSPGSFVPHIRQRAKRKDATPVFVLEAVRDFWDKNTIELKGKRKVARYCLGPHNYIWSQIHLMKEGSTIHSMHDEFLNQHSADDPSFQISFTLFFLERPFYVRMHHVESGLCWHCLLMHYLYQVRLVCFPDCFKDVSKHFAVLFSSILGSLFFRLLLFLLIRCPLLWFSAV
jgi:hypothetical protein